MGTSSPILGRLGRARLAARRAPTRSADGPAASAVPRFFHREAVSFKARYRTPAPPSFPPFSPGDRTNANQRVRATLLCANDGNVLHNSGLVPLEANRDFRINDMLSPAVPFECVSPVLLIRNPAGAWFAAGIPKQ